MTGIIAARSVEGIGSSSSGPRGRSWARLLVILSNGTKFITGPLRKIDMWINKRIKEPPSGESGWYINTGEGRAIAAGAEATEGADTITADSSPNIKLAIEAVRQVEIPKGTDYGDVLEATFQKYRELRSDEEGSTPTVG